MLTASIKVSYTGIELGIPVELQRRGMVPSYCQKLRKNNSFGCSVRYLPEVMALFRNKPVDYEAQYGTTLAEHLYYFEIQRRKYSDQFKHEQFEETENSSLWEHQQRGVALASVNSRYAFFYDTRTGKTRMAYQIMLDALKAGTASRCIVFVPSSIIPDWLSDAKAFPELKVNAYYNDTKTKHAALTHPCHILLFSIEQAASNAELLSRLHFDICFFDESSKLKNHKSQISKFMREYSKNVFRFYLLSATPAPNGYHEYYTQMMCIDPYIFPIARTHFVNKYFNNTSRDTKYERLKIKEELRIEFEGLLEEYAIYVDQKVMPTAGKKFIIQEYALDTDTQKLYDTMCRDMSAIVNDTEITVDMAAAMRSKLQQIVSGFVINTEVKKEIATAKFLKEEYLGTDKEIEILPVARDARLQELANLLEKHNDERKFIVWANYKQEFHDIATLLYQKGYSFGILNGDTPLAEKERLVNCFKRINDIEILICHPLSVGMGKNFTESHIAIYYSLTDSWEAFKQSSERIAGHIKVQPKQCLYYILQARKTINTLMYDNIANKRDQSYGLLEHLKSRGIIEYDN